MLPRASARDLPRAGARRPPRPDRLSEPAVPVEVVNTIGAGDAFMAGVLGWLTANGVRSGDDAAHLPGGRVTGMLAFASRLAASVCAQHGTEPLVSAVPRTR